MNLYKEYYGVVTDGVCENSPVYAYVSGQWPI